MTRRLSISIETKTAAAPAPSLGPGVLANTSRGARGHGREDLWNNTRHNSRGSTGNQFRRKRRRKVKNSGRMPSVRAIPWRRVASLIDGGVM
jgi:hypothetical protein